MNDKPANGNASGEAKPTERAGLPVERAQETRVDLFRERQGYTSYAQEDESGFDVLRYLRLVSKYRWLIAGVSLLVFALTAAVNLTTTPLYTATSSLQIEREATKILEKGDVVAEETGGMEFYQTQAQLLQSRALAERVAAALSLGGDQAFNQREAPSLLALAKQKITRLILPVNEGDVEAGKSLEVKQSEAAGRLLQGLNTELVRGSRIATISFTHPNPAVAQRVSIGYAEVFITDNLDRRFEATAYARKFLEERLLQLKVKLEESEKLLVEYAEDKGILTVGDGKTVVDFDVEAVAAKLTEARYEKIRTELMWRRVESAKGMEIAEIRNSETVQENRKLKSELSAEYQQKLNVFKPSYPEMVQLKSKITELDEQLDQAVLAVKSDIKSSYEAARISVAMLEAELERGKEALVIQRNRGIQFNILQREVDTNRQLYDGLLQRYKEIGVAGGIGTNNISFVDKAQLPSAPSSPKLTRNLVIGLAAGLILGFMIALGLDFLDETFKLPDEVERAVGVPVVGIIPLPKDGASVEDALADQHSPMSEAYRSLRTSLQFSTPEGLPSSILVTSATPSEGKSTTVIGIADSLGKMGQKVLVIDADLRKPTLHKKLNLRNERGLTNYLIGGVEAADMLQITSYRNVFAITSGPLPPNPAELLSGNRMADLISAAGEAYDTILIDGPPIIGLADSLLLASASQVTLLVVGAKSTRKSALQIAFRRMQGVRANIIGSVLNKFDRREARYGYGYGYGSSDYEYYGYGKKQLPSPEA